MAPATFWRSTLLVMLLPCTQVQPVAAQQSTSETRPMRAHGFLGAALMRSGNQELDSSPFLAGLQLIVPRDRVEIVPLAVLAPSLTEGAYISLEAGANLALQRNTYVGGSLGISRFDFDQPHAAVRLGFGRFGAPGIRAELRAASYSGGRSGQQLAFHLGYVF